MGGSFHVLSAVSEARHADHAQRNRIAVLKCIE